MTAQLFMFNGSTRGKPAALPDFEAWWAAYPHKVGKGAARPAYAAALRKATPEQLIDGVRRYVASKPETQAWCHPSTWLNQERWLDEPAADATAPQPIDPDANLRAMAKTIAAGLSCPSASPAAVREMLRRGWITEEQAKRAGL